MAKTAKRAATAVATGGLSEWSHGQDAFGARSLTNAIGLTKKPAALAGMPGENPAAVLAQTGGAPLLANIALGANVEDTIAGYFGAADYGSLYNSVNPQDRQLLMNVRKQLTDIQSNTNLRNKAVQQVVDDFPNIVAQAAQARTASGQEFDDVTKGYIDQALNKVGAKYAAGGMLSSGATAAASARAGAEYGMQKLGYMDGREEFKYNQGLQGWQARYNETNALRNFQNLMTGQAAGNGFSAVQASLNRNQQAQMANVNAQNQQNFMNQQQDNAMFGAIGGLAGTALGGAFLGRGMGGAQAGSASSGYSPSFPQGSQTMNEPFGSFSGNPKLNLPRSF